MNDEFKRIPFNTYKESMDENLSGENRLARHGGLFSSGKSYSILKYATEKFVNSFHPLSAEPIWNYWHEQGMVTNTMHAIASRFQNETAGPGPDPLANLDLNPLRPLNNLVLGYMQDAKPHAADSRPHFIEAFHSLLHKVPDTSSLLNALREVHLLLAEGASNQTAQLTATARAGMLIEQYILSQPEIREFLGGRVMAPYDEAWMNEVDVMKSIQGWPGASISYYRDLAVNGEEIMLSIRWINWSQVNSQDIAREWAILFRTAVQRYIFSYKAVTNIDLSA